MICRRLIIALATVGVCALPAAAASAPDAQVKQLLTRACLGCHGPQRAKGGLRIDRDSSLRGVLVPGKAAASELVRRLRGLGPDPRMPVDAPALAPGEIALVQRWIDAGAPGLAADAADPAASAQANAHWAYQPPVRPPLPAVRDPAWPRNPIDKFVLAGLAQAGLRPAPAAEREALIRRVTLDLTGLPPSLAEVDAFVADHSTGAYERVVDRLLASPHFGERWAVPWLDAARYADSNGYEKDGARAIWKYRDWVVDALNADLPFDRFTLEQLAGDLLPNPEPSAQIATGFHRNTMFNEEAGVDPEEARWERLVDRATTTASVWLGSTLACAQCHDHKHDPFSQQDFYALLAFFEDGREDTLRLPSLAQQQRLTALAAERARLDQMLQTWTPALGEAQRHWEQQLRTLPEKFHRITLDSYRSEAGAALLPLPDGSLLVTGADVAMIAIAGREVETVIGSAPHPRITGVRLEALPDARLPAGGPGRGNDGGFFLQGITLETAATGPEAAWQPVPLAAVVADEQPRVEPERYAAVNLLPQTARAPTLDADVPRGWGVDPGQDGTDRRPRQLVLLPERPFGFPGGTRLRMRLVYGDASQGDVIGRFRLSVTDLPAPGAVAALDPRMRQVLELPEAERSQQQRNQLAQAFRAHTPLLDAARTRRTQLVQEENALGVVSSLIMAPHRAGAAAPVTPLRRGGAFLRPGPAIAAATPAVFRTPRAPRNRLELARWLVSADNPLVARVLVNRLWAQYFGRGLVETSEDFGSQGARPVLPQLLDWLATEFTAGGWRAKPLHRLIVTSATYRQSASVAPARRQRRGEAVALDWLSRGPRLRLEAEMVRDVALFASGLLDRRRGGPPVFPAQPAGVWAPPNSSEGPWQASPAPDRHRRALYVFWRRTAPYPSLALFDAPSREQCSVRRARTLSPLQALATLNDPTFWEASQALARRMRLEPPAGAPLQTRIRHGFRLCTGRRPRPAELAPLLALYQRQRRAQPRHADQTALALVANVLLNLDETLSKN